ncbi:glycosyltransferase family 2 protein [Mucilaginibacter sp. KACC 22063]|uniref:glycosyltransferase family 2 protein n=1 Tax=Mucilaginibacter sp. KACC 22063 TaxID=3025666 RepID=UPI0023654DC0|nr:glycosyltransferase family A protein [Mucilaginibacter sp. KACC 22063]WDF53814.1 glycosyltransferase family A protein [Mucilaginibacter sp. KACC 22063]
MSTPLITVLMPAYNAGSFMAEAISSILEQTFTDFELLIVNDGSTDDTEAIIKSFTDPRIVLINQSNGGVAAALNTGLKNARAAYIARFDADDICNPHRLAIQYHFMESHPEYGVIGSCTDYIDKQGNYVFTHEPAAFEDAEIRKVILKECLFIHSSVFYRKALVTDLGGYDENAHTFEDHLLWLKVIKHCKVCNLQENLITVRLSPESVTIDERWHHPRFTEIKQKALKQGQITADEAKELLEVLKAEREQQINLEAYYGLLAKKFLWNNHDPEKARENLQKLMALNRFSLQCYLLFLVSLFPGSWIHKIYHVVKG